MKKLVALIAFVSLAAGLASAAQSAAGGSVEGLITDPSGAAIPGASASLLNRITNYHQTAETDQNGHFHISNVPPNTYHIEISASGFSTAQQDISVRSTVPVAVNVQLELAGSSTSVTVEVSGADMLETVTYAHNDLGENALAKLPSTSPGAGLSDAITLASPGVVSDSNGFFHPLGDHAQTSFSIDGQPINDQQSKQFSTQIPVNALQSMELITGSPPAEFGDKTSLVVNAVTRSGLGQKLNGGFLVEAGSFGSYSEEASLGGGTTKLGNFLVFNVARSGRFLDSPEFTPIHDIGNNGSVFDRIDWRPNEQNSFHVNMYAVRNWFQIPNTFDQLNQDQRQRVLTFDFAPGYQHTFSPSTLVTVNTFFRRDQVNFYPSADPFFDNPATVSQQRFLTNYGLKSDIAYVNGAHNLKAGAQIMQTRLSETFSLGVTDPNFNAVCVDAGGNPQGLPRIVNPNQCAGAGFTANPQLQPGLLPFDLTRGGQPFRFRGAANINQYAFYIQDSIKLGHFSLNPGLRIDQYNGLTADTGIEPRFGLSYLINRTNTVVRAAYSRTLETPYNENLIVSSSTGVGGLATNVFGAVTDQPLNPGRRNQFNAGLQQSIGHWLLIDADYFWKFTRNAYDFDTLFNTPIQFPISWRRSKIDGVAVRVSTPDLHGFQAFTTLGHTRARFFGPEIGGLVFNSPLDTGVFRIDHDQAFQQTTQLRYQYHKDGPWFAFTWRYDSGGVAGHVPDLASALALTGAQQAAIGFACDGRPATLTSPITSCAGAFAADRVRIPKPGTFNPDSNPPRIAPRQIFDLGAGTDNLFRTEHVHTILRLTVVNLTNKVALYNFLSTFSGTHFVTPRAYQAQVGVNF